MTCLRVGRGAPGMQSLWIVVMLGWVDLLAMLYKWSQWTCFLIMQGLSEIISVVIGTQSGLCHLFMLTQGKPCKGMWHYPECWMYCTNWLVSIFMGKYHLTKFDAYFGLDIISSLRTHPTLRLVVTGRRWLCILCFVFIMVMTWTSSVTPASLEQYSQAANCSQQGDLWAVFASQSLAFPTYVPVGDLRLLYSHRLYIGTVWTTLKLLYADFMLHLHCNFHQKNPMLIRKNCFNMHLSITG